MRIGETARINDTSYRYGGYA